MENEAYKKLRLDLGRVPVEQKQDKEKLNPNSLRFILGYIIKEYYDGNVSHAADEMRQFGGRYNDRRSDREKKNITDKAILNLLSDNEYFTYWHLEIMSRAIGVPVGALLCISRYYSYKRYEDRAGGRIFIECMRSLLGDMERHLEADLGKLRDINRMSAHFSALREHDSHSPMLF